MNRKPIGWTESELQARLQAAWRLEPREAPADLARRVSDRVREGRRTAGPGPRRTWAVLTTAATSAAALLVVLQIRPLPPTQVEAPSAELTNAIATLPAPTGTAQTKPRTPARPARSQPRPAASVAARPSPPLALERWEHQQAQDFEIAARLLERAGQAEPASELYSSSLDVAPTLEATLGLARTMRMMDEAVLATRGTEVAAPAPGDSSG